MSWRSKLSHVFQELRIHLCQTSPSSTATREFITRNYVDLKALNPTLPLLIRECSGVQPRLWARYDYGVEHSVPLDGLAAHEIDVKLEELVNLGIPERFQGCLWHQRADIFIFVSNFLMLLHTLLTKQQSLMMTNSGRIFLPVSSPTRLRSIHPQASYS